jgi:protein-arginine kinase
MFFNHDYYLKKMVEYKKLEMEDLSRNLNTIRYIKQSSGNETKDVLYKIKKPSVNYQTNHGRTCVCCH